MDRGTWGATGQSHKESDTAEAASQAGTHSGPSKALSLFRPQVPRCPEDTLTLLSPGPAHGRLLASPCGMSEAQTHCLSQGGSREEASPSKQCQSCSSAFMEEGARGRAEGSGRPLKGHSGFRGCCALNSSESLLGLRLPASCVLNFTEILFSQLFCQGSPGEWEKNTVNLSLLIFSEIFFTSRILESCHLLVIPLPGDWHLTVGSRGPPSPTFLLWKRFRCQSVQACGPVSLSGNSTQAGLSTASESPALDPFSPWEELGVSTTQRSAGSES